MAEERKCNDTSCSGDCSSCSKAGNHEIEKAESNVNSNVKKVIGVVSGKSGSVSRRGTGKIDDCGVG